MEGRVRKRSIMAKNITGGMEPITTNVLMNLIKSMPRRVEACIASKGWPTKY